MREIKGFPEYMITIKGEITKNGNRVNQYLDTRGYNRVTLFKSGNKYSRLVHRLLAETYLDNKMNCLYVKHKDGDTLHNDIMNLEWHTNKRHKGKYYPVLMYDMNMNFIREYYNPLEASNDTHHFRRSIIRCCNEMQDYTGTQNTYQYRWRWKIL